MKKSILFLVASLALYLSSEAQLRVGIKAGGSKSSQHVSGSSLFSNDRYKNFQAGLIGDLQVAGNFYLQPQLLYSRKGSTLLDASGKGDTKVRMNYIEMPVNIVYKHSMSFGKLFAGAGPYFSYGFGGNQTQDGHSQGLYSRNGWKHEDIGLNFTAGVEFYNGLFVSVNSQKGLFDVYKLDNVSIKNRSLSLSVGYLIDWDQFKRKNRG